jgi:hypothetical protein
MKCDFYSGQLWPRSLLLGSACYALANGLVHFSDWCYLAASAAVAAVVSAGLGPLHRWLVAQMPRRLQKWPLLWALGCTLAVFGLGILLTWPLRSWPGPNGLWPWGSGALLATIWSQQRSRAGTLIPETGTITNEAATPAISVPTPL